MKIAIALTVAVVCATMFAATDAKETYTYSCNLLQTLGYTDVFECRSGTDLCTKKRFECDSIKDCPDFSDEDHCAKKHAENCVDDFAGKMASNDLPLQKYECGDGMCILGCYRCDNELDCLDGSDEAGCTENEIIPPCY